MFNDQSGQNQETADGYKKDFLNREIEMRSPWHDIGSSLVGQAAADVGRHFIERWNNHMMARFKAAVKMDSLLGLRQWRIPAIGESLAKQIISPKKGFLIYVRVGLLVRCLTFSGLVTAGMITGGN